MAASGKRFVIDRQADPVDFLSWFLNVLHADLTGGKRKKPSVVTRCFQVRRDWGFCSSMWGCHERASVCGMKLCMRGQCELRQALWFRLQQQIIISRFGSGKRLTTLHIRNPETLG